MAHDIFISYSTKDQKIVEGLSAYLEQNGIRCWVAYRDIPIGKDWADFIPKAIEECKIMVYVHSATSNISAEINKEIALCLKNGHPIIPFKIENVDYLGSKAYHLVTINWIDAFPNPEKCFGKLLSSIQNISSEPNQVSKTQLENKKDRNKTKKWSGYILGGIIVLIFAVLAFVQYSNSEKVKSDLKTYSELATQAEEDYRKGEEYFVIALDNYEKAIHYETLYADSKHADKFDLNVENKKNALAKEIDSLFDIYKTTAVDAFNYWQKNEKIVSEKQIAKQYVEKALKLKEDPMLSEIRRKLSN